MKSTGYPLHSPVSPSLPLSCVTVCYHISTVRISGSNAGYTMFRCSVKSTGYPFLSSVSPSLPLPCVTVCHHISTGVYKLSGTPCFPYVYVFLHNIIICRLYKLTLSVPSHCPTKRRCFRVCVQVFKPVRPCRGVRNVCLRPKPALGCPRCSKCGAIWCASEFQNINGVYLRTGVLRKNMWTK